MGSTKLSKTWAWLEIEQTWFNMGSTFTNNWTPTHSCLQFLWTPQLVPVPLAAPSGEVRGEAGREVCLPHLACPSWRVSFAQQNQFGHNQNGFSNIMGQKNMLNQTTKFNTNDKLMDLFVSLQTIQLLW